MGALSVRKGKTFERTVANDLAALQRAADERRRIIAGEAPPPAPTGKPPRSAVRRGLSQSRGGGAEEPDVVVGDLDLHVEVKHSNSISPAALMRQALNDVRQSGTSNTLVIGVLKRDREQPEAFLFAWDAMRVFGWWHACPVIESRAPSDPYRRGSLVRPYPATTPVGIPGSVQARDLGPVVSIVWPEYLTILDAVWDSLPTKSRGGASPA